MADEPLARGKIIAGLHLLLSQIFYFFCPTSLCIL
jgi:hypothetical protein